MHGPATIDAIVLISSHDRPEVVIDDVVPAEVAGRMTASLEHERHALLEAYRQFRFAVPDRRCDAIERAPEMESRLITRAFEGHRVAWLRHPYPPDIDSLFSPIARHLAEDRREVQLVS